MKHKSRRAVSPRKARRYADPSRTQEARQKAVSNADSALWELPAVVWQSTEHTMLTAYDMPSLSFGGWHA